MPGRSHRKSAGGEGPRTVEGYGHYSPAGRGAAEGLVSSGGTSFGRRGSKLSYNPPTYLRRSRSCPRALPHPPPSCWPCLVSSPAFSACLSSAREPLRKSLTLNAAAAPPTATPITAAVRSPLLIRPRATPSEECQAAVRRSTPPSAGRIRCCGRSVTGRTTRAPARLPSRESLPPARPAGDSTPWTPAT